MRFVDTNILLYAVSTVADERAKSETARSVLSGRDLALSVQVLQEFYVQATRADKPDALSHQQTIDLIDALLRFPIHGITVPLMQAAFETRDRFRISYWDASIIEAARFAKCDTTVLSEDLQDGQNVGGVRIHNPFR